MKLIPSCLAPIENCSNRISIRGRIKTIRQLSKKLLFLDLINSSTNSITQIMFNKSKLNSQSSTDLWNKFKIGSILEIQGIPYKSPTGRETIMALNYQPLSTTITKPIVWNTGLSDENSCRNRHLDLLINWKSRQVFERRFEMFWFIRNYLNRLGFKEVETPILSSGYSGATAKPFVINQQTNCQEDDLLFLRISPELNLKRLIVGGFEKIYEIGKQFRNESADSTHNPEFTSLELYQAYSNVTELFSFTEQFLESICRHLNCGNSETNGIQFKGPYKRIDVTKRLLEIFQITQIQELDLDRINCFLSKWQLRCNNLINGIEKVIEYSIERELEKEPVFLFNQPAIISPLAKPFGEGGSERFELFVNRMELVNAYSELTDPVLQLRNFKLSMEMSQDESTRNEELKLSKDLVEYCEVLECGMPPTAGWGIGLDRLAMIMILGEEQIKKVILFPFLTSKNQQ